MCSLDEVYGTSYKVESINARIDYTINILAKNIANQTFNLKLDECDLLWNNSEHIDIQSINKIINKIKTINRDMLVKHIDISYDDNIKLLPYIITNSSVEYFYIIDYKCNRCYIIYITPSYLGVY